MAAMALYDLPLQPDACYLALKAKDARFDGRFFTGVTSTGIYCRPVCRVRTPRRENCRFFAHAAQAEGAGFRPCLRCRPELAPAALHWSLQDGGAILAQQAARLLDEPEAWRDEPPSIERLAARLGVSDRHLRRIFEAHLGVSPLQYLQTRRLLAAKQLLADTQLPVTQVALASGYSSVRRFNAAFAAHYGLNPTELRRAGAAVVRETPQVKLAYRPPYDVQAMLGFFAARAVQGVEQVDLATQTLSRTASVGGCHGWFSVRFDEAQSQALLWASDSLQPVLPSLMRRVRALLDLDADPQAINGVLHASFPTGDGLRVPGAVSGFELAVRAVLGQQVTVAAARTFAQRLVERFGERLVHLTRHSRGGGNLGLPSCLPLERAIGSQDALDSRLRRNDGRGEDGRGNDGRANDGRGSDGEPPHRLFPTAEALVAASPDALGELGIVRQRQGAIQALARAVVEGGLELHTGADVQATMARLRELPGIGDWTAHYIAMRALRWPDAFPAGDVALHKALGVQQSRQPAREAEAASQAWRPWRSYAVLRAWSQLD